MSDLELSISIAEELYLGELTLENALKNPNLPNSILYLFACDVAERALKREEQYGRKADYRSWEFIHIAREWVRGIASKKELIETRVGAIQAQEIAANLVDNQQVNPTINCKNVARAAARASSSAAWGFERDIDKATSIARLAAEASASNAAWCAIAANPSSSSEQYDKISYEEALQKEKQWQIDHLASLIRKNIPQDYKFDIFLSHHSADKPLVTAIALRLKESGFKIWFDLWDLTPGKPWQEEIEQAIEQSKVVAVFMGIYGLGPWQNEELRTALEIRVKENDRLVIPILLPSFDLPLWEKVPRFLQRLTRIQFKNSISNEEAFQRLRKTILDCFPFREDTGVKQSDMKVHRLSDLRVKALSAKSVPDLQYVFYEIEELLDTYPNNPEAKQLRDLVKTAVERERYHLELDHQILESLHEVIEGLQETPQKDLTPIGIRTRTRYFLLISFLLIFVSIFILIAYWLFY